MLALALLGDQTQVSLVMARTYVALHVLHSLIQALANINAVRFALFVLSTLPLFVLTGPVVWE